MSKLKIVDQVAQREWVSGMIKEWQGLYSEKRSILDGPNPGASHENRMRLREIDTKMFKLMDKIKGGSILLDRPISYDYTTIYQ